MRTRYLPQFDADKMAAMSIKTYPTEQPATRPAPVKFHPDTITVGSLERMASMAVAFADSICTIARDSADGTIDPQTAALAANAALSDLVGPVAMAGGELLAVCETLVGPTWPNIPQLMMLARAAIASAKGGDDCPNCNQLLQPGEAIHRCDQCGGECCSHCSTIQGLCDDCDNIQPQEL